MKAKRKRRTLADEPEEKPDKERITMVQRARMMGGKRISKCELIPADDGVGFKELEIIIDGEKILVRAQEGSKLGRISLKY